MPKKTIQLPYFIFGILCVAFAFLLFSNIVRGLLNRKTGDTFQPSLQRIELKIPAAGFIAKTEHLVLASEDGKVERLQEAGTLVRTKTEIVHLKKHSQSSNIETIFNEFEGIVTYIKDECEEKYQLSNVDQLLLQEILQPPIKQSRVGDDQTVKKGDFIFKIVENDLMHFVLIIEPQYQKALSNIYQQQFSIGSDINFRVEFPSNLMVGCNIVRQEKREKDYQLIILSSPYYVDLMLNQRKVNGFFSFGFVSASLIPDTSLIFDESGKTYVLEKQDQPERIPVEILGIDPSTMQYIVSGLESSQEIYTHAKNWDSSQIEQ